MVGADWTIGLSTFEQYLAAGFWMALWHGIIGLNLTGCLCILGLGWVVVNQNNTKKSAKAG